MTRISTLEKSEIEIAQLRSFGQITPTFCFILFVGLAGNLIIHEDKAQWFWPFYLQLAVIFLTAIRGGAWYWLNKHPRISARHSNLIIRSEIAIYIIFAPIISITTLYYMMGANEYQLIYSYVSHVTISVLACFNLCYMRKTSAFVIIFALAPIVGHQFYDFNFNNLALAVLITAIGGSALNYTRVYFRDFLFAVNSKIDIVNLLEKNAKLASIDMLTDLPNRRFYFEELAKLFAQSHERNQIMAVGVIDLDGFKPVNDTYGHRVGDRVLAMASRRLANAHPRTEQMCRIGGDEFAFIVRDLQSVDELISIGDSIVAAMFEPFAIGDLSVGVGCSIGFASSDQYRESQGEETKPEILYEYADFALYHAKRTGKSRSVIFANEHRNILTQRGKLEQALRVANLDEEIYPVFQPMVHVGSGQTSTFEALARWKSPTLGNVSPGQFIPVIEQAGLMSRITPLLLKKSLDHMKFWPEEIGLSFNLSSQDLCSPDTIAKVLELVLDSDIKSDRIAFEVTESTVIHEFDLALNHIELIRSKGIKVALDDFGTGYSSLSYVNKLPLDKLKIDKSFVDDIETSEASQNIVRTVISLCRDLKMQCVVEGAETQGQIAMLVRLGCEMVQGYFYSKPMVANDIAPFLLKAVDTRFEQSDLRAAPEANGEKALAG